MQELIERIKDHRETETSPLVISMLNRVLIDAMSLRKKEKEVMTHFATKHKFEGGNAVRLFDETFNNEESAITITKNIDNQRT